MHASTNLDRKHLSIILLRYKQQKQFLPQFYLEQWLTIFGGVSWRIQYSSARGWEFKFD